MPDLKFILLVPLSKMIFSNNFVRIKEDHTGKRLLIPKFVKQKKYRLTHQILTLCKIKDIEEKAKNKNTWLNLKR